jgi:hypothetical protein
MGQRGHFKSRGLYLFRWKTKRQLSIGNKNFCTSQNNIGIKRAVFRSNRMSYIVLRGQWFHIIVTNVHALTEEKSDNSKSF